MFKTDNMIKSGLCPYVSLLSVDKCALAEVLLTFIIRIRV